MAESGEGSKPVDKDVVGRRNFLRKAAIFTGGALAAAFLPSKFKSNGVEGGSAHAQNSTNDELPKDSQPATTEASSEGIPSNKNEIIDQILNKNDLIPRDELWEKYKIKILDSPDVTFDFRKTAIEREHLFKSQINRNGAVKIVLIDGHYIHPKFLTEEQKKQLEPEEITALIRDTEKAKKMVIASFTAEKVVQQKKNEYLQKTGLLDAKLAAGEISQDKHDVMVEVYDDEYRPYLKGPSDEDLLQDLTGMAPPINDRFPQDPEATKLIFLPVKDPPVKMFKVGNEKIKVETDPYFLRAPRTENSFTDPDTLKMDFKGELYPIQNPNLDTVSRHEIKHAAGMGHPAADFEPYNDLVIAKREARNGNYDGYWAVWRDRQNGVMIGQKESVVKAA